MRNNFIFKAIGTDIAPALRGGTMGGVAAVLFTCLLASSAQAHFILRKPDSYVDQEEGAFGGAPQKAGPCGPGGGDDVQPIPTNDKLTELHVGDPLHFEWEITVPHDGYFRIALAEDRGDFEDPEFTDAVACTYDDASVMKGAHGNVLMDGIDPDALSQDLVVPNMPCEKCTLQVIQVMKNHGPPNCIYYHCADVKILPAGGGSGTGGMSAGSGGMGAGSGGVTGMAGSGGMTSAAGSGGKGAAGSGTAGMGVAAGSGGKGGTGGGGTTAAAGSGGMASAGTGGGGAMVVPPPTEKDDGGCSVATPGSRASSALVWSMLGVGAIGLGWRRRRR